MTGLRSREVKVAPITELSSMSKSVDEKPSELSSIEPKTPLKTLDKKPSEGPSNSSTPCSSPLVNKEGSGSGIVLRRSSRLASKSGSNDIDCGSVVLGRKRKRTDSKTDKDLDVGNNESKDDKLNGKMGAYEKFDAGENGKEESEDDYKLDEIEDEGIAFGVDSELGSDSGGLRQMSESVEASKKGKGKRKLVPEFELVGEGDSNDGYRKLRSGKKIVTRRVGKDSMGAESACFHDSVHENVKEEEEEDGNMTKVLSNTSRECTAVDDSKGNMILDDNGSLIGSQRDCQISSVDHVKELKTNVDPLVGTTHVDPLVGTKVTGALDAKLVENDYGADQFGFGDKDAKTHDGDNKLKQNVTEHDLFSSYYDQAELDLFTVEKSNEEENGLSANSSCFSSNGKRSLRRNEKGKDKVHENGLSSNEIGAVELDLSNPEIYGELKIGPSPDANGTRTQGSSRRFSRAEKGKAKLVRNVVELESRKVGNLNNDNGAVQDRTQVLDSDAGANVTRTRERFRDAARRNASRFAYFSSTDEVHDEAETELPPREVEKEMEDWPGPFSTAMKIIKERQMNGNVQQQNLHLDKGNSPQVMWVPKQDQDRNSSKLLVPLLQDLCMTVLVKNADAITSLDFVPDVLRHKLCHLLCDSRRMNNNFFELLVRGSPTEIRVRDCSWLTEEKFTETFQGADISRLMVLQLDQCGRCMPDYILFSTLARSSNCLPVLTTISLKGACRLSDVGLSSILSCAPVVRSINLGQCLLLTSGGISSIADSLGPVLKELYLDDCQSVDAMIALPALSKLQQLEVLSVSGLQTVCDDFVRKFVAVRGHNLKELVLADCENLTDCSIKAISEVCAGICALDLNNLCKLTDSALGYLANGCQSIHSLKFRRNVFSDEAIAAYLETRGQTLEELSLNNVNKVAYNTAISLSRRSKNLKTLDLSWCRNLTNEAVGLIVDSCLSLKMLKLFGCTQITKVFLDGHSNAQVQVIGLKMTPILEHIKVPDLVGPLHYSAVSSL